MQIANFLEDWVKFVKDLRKSVGKTNPRREGGKRKETLGDAKCH